MRKETKAYIDILSILNDFEMSERISIVERIDKRLRQQNSVETAKEISDFTRKNRLKKDIDYSPVLKNK